MPNGCTIVLNLLSNQIRISSAKLLRYLCKWCIGNLYSFQCGESQLKKRGGLRGVGRPRGKVFSASPSPNHRNPWSKCQEKKRFNQRANRKLLKLVGKFRWVWKTNKKGHSAAVLIIQYLLKALVPSSNPGSSFCPVMQSLQTFGSCLCFPLHDSNSCTLTHSSMLYALMPRPHHPHAVDLNMQWQSPDINRTWRTKD